MKTTLMILAMMSVALVGCGKKDSKSSNAGFISAYGVQTTSGYITVPNQSQSAYNTAPVIQIGANTYQMSQQSSYEARLAIQQMYAGTSSYRFVDQTATGRRYVANLTVQCGSGLYNSGYNQQYNQYNQQYNNQYQQNGQCPVGSQLIVQTMTP